MFSRRHLFFFLLFCCLFFVLVSPLSFSLILSPPPPPTLAHCSKHKTAHKAVVADEKKLTASLRRLGAHQIPIEEVTFVMEDGSGLAFASPKLQVNVQANTYVVSGTPQTQTAEQLALRQMDSLQGLQELLAQLRAGAGQGAPAFDPEGAAEDDDVPTLVENFEATADKEEEKKEESA